MSTEIDNRIVNMQFNNADFEKNVSTTMSTLDKLKSALKFDKATEALKELQNESKNFTLEPIKNAFEAFSDSIERSLFIKFERIKQQALDSIEQFAKSVTIDPITQGFERYSDKTQTFMTLAAQGFKDSEVTDQYERLAWYADETSYSLNDMLDNVSKFTAAGLGLEDSATAMMGIANWAALSGQNAQTASRAMYQLSQAMGRSVQLQDWRSIMNANMDTREFRQKALDAAVKAGTLQYNADDNTYTSLMNDNTEDFTIDQFVDHLTQDAWLTRDVMMDVLQDYGGAVDRIRDYAEEHGVTASQAIVALRDEFDEFQIKAFLAAQEARSFKDAITAVQDPIMTIWSNIWGKIFGDGQAAVETWTKLANDMYDIFVTPLWSVLDLFTEWGDNLAGRKIFLEGLFNLLKFGGDLIKTVSAAFSEIIPPITAERLLELTVHFRKFTKQIKLIEEITEDGEIIFTEFGEKVSRVFKGLFAAFDIVKTVVGAVFGIFFDLIKFILPPLAGGFLDGAAGVGDFLVKLDEALKKGDKIKNFTSKITEPIKAGIIAIRDFFGNAFEFIQTKFEALRNSPIAGWFSSLGDSFGSGIRAFSAIWKNSAPDVSIWDRFKNSLQTAIHFLSFNFNRQGGFSALLNAFQDTNLWKNAVANIDKLKASFSKFWDSFKQTKVGGWINSFFEELKSAYNDIVAWFQEHFQGKGTLGESIAGMWRSLTYVGEDGTFSFLDNLKATWEKLKELFSNISFKDIWEQLKAFASDITNFATEHKDLLEKLGLVGGVIFGIIKLFEHFTKSGELISNTASGVSSISGFLKSAKNLMGNLADFTDSLSEAVTAYKWKMIGETLKNFAMTVLILAGAMLVLTLIPDQRLDRVGAWAASLMIMVAMIFDRISKTASEMKGKSLASFAVSVIMVMLLLSNIVKQVVKLGKLQEAGLDVWQLIYQLSALMIGVIYFTKNLEKSLGDNNNFKAFNAVKKIIASLGIFILLIKIIGNMDPNEMFQGFVGLGLLMIEVGVFFYALSKIDFSRIEKASLTLLAIAGAVLIMAGVVVLISNFGGDNIWSSIGVMAALMGLMLAFVVVLSLLAMIPKLNLSGIADTLIKISISMVVVAAALLLMTGALTLIAGMGDAVWPSILALAAVLGLAVVALLAFTFVGVLMQKFKVGETLLMAGIGAAAFGAALFLLGLAIMIIGPQLIGFAVIAVLALGAVAAAFIAIAPILAAAVVAAVWAILKVLAISAPHLIDACCDILRACIDGLKALAPLLIELIYTLVGILMATLAVLADPVVESVVSLILLVLNNIANTIRAHKNQLITIFKNVVSLCLEILIDLVNEALKLLVGSMTSFLDGITGGKFGITEAVYASMDEFASSSGEVVRKWLQVEDLGEELQNGITDAWSGFSLESVQGIIENTAESRKGGFADTIANTLAGGGLSKALSSKGEEAGEAAGEGVAEGTEKGSSAAMSAMASFAESVGLSFGESGEGAGENFMTALTGSLGDMSDVGGSIDLSSMTGGMGLDIEGMMAGDNFLAAFTGTVEDGSETGYDAASMLGDYTVEGLEDSLDINSPSKKATAAGEYFDNGFIIGMGNLLGKVGKSSEKVGTTAVDGINKALLDNQDVLSGNFEDDWTIRPVVDTSNVDEFNDSLEDTTQNRSIALRGLLDDSNTRAVNAQEVLERFALQVHDDHVQIMASISKIEDRINSAVDAIGNMKVVTETDALVGQIYTKVDTKINKLNTKRFRGVVK